MIIDYNFKHRTQTKEKKPLFFFFQFSFIELAKWIACQPSLNLLFPKSYNYKKNIYPWSFWTEKGRKTDIETAIITIIIIYIKIKLIHKVSLEFIQLEPHTHTYKCIICIDWPIWLAIFINKIFIKPAMVGDLNLTCDMCVHVVLN